MRERNDETAFCAARVETSTALALASTDSCARASHVGIAKAYSDRLATLTRAARRPDTTVVPDEVVG
jgi:hypothetical protein